MFIGGRKVVSCPWFCSLAIIYELVSYMRYADWKISIGHMFNQHYIDPMFPLSTCQKQAMKEKRSILSKCWERVAGHPGDHSGGKSNGLFLDQIVKTDGRLSIQREYTVIAEMGVMRRESGLEFGNGQVLRDCEDANGDGFMTFLRTASDRVVVEEARDKTVKDLSRLWKYLGGKSPMDYE